MKLAAAALALPQLRALSAYSLSQAYGFLIDTAYAQDEAPGVKFLLSAVLYLNAAGVLNDDEYGYDRIGLSFLRDPERRVYAAGCCRASFTADLLQKPCPQLGRGQHAAFPPPKPTVAVAGNEAVERVAPGAGQQPAHARQRPPAAQPPGNAQHRRGVGVELPATQQQHRIKLCRASGGRKSVFSQQGLPGFALQGRETETAGLVVADDKLYEAVAQVAHAIKENDIGRHGDRGLLT